MKKLIRGVMKFLDGLKEGHVSAYSAQAAYFIIMSIFPFVLILLSLIRFTPLTKGMLMEMVTDVLPVMFHPIINGIIEELYERASAVLSVSVVLALWSSAKCVLALTNGLNTLFGLKETRNYVVLRLRSAAYTLAFVLMIVLSLALMVFGERINAILLQHLPKISGAFRHVLDWRLLMVIAFQTIIFLLMYRFLPNRKCRIMKLLPGALFASIGWNVFSYLFSIYVEYGRLSYTYGSLTTLVVVMIWLYFCMYMIFIGAWINQMVAWWEEREKQSPLKIGRKKAENKA